MAPFTFYSNSLSTFIVLLILMFTIANYFSMNKKFTVQERRLADTENFDFFNDQVPIRELRKNALLSAESVRKDILKHAVGKDNQNFYPKLKPEAFCPERYRIGEKEDGGKVVCKPRAVRDDCTLLSLGLNNQVEYDQKIMNITDGKCTILAADKDTQNMNTLRAFAAMKGRVFTGKIPDELTIGEILEKSYRKDVEILKIDIEGGENTGLEPFLKYNYVCQILIEIHGWPPEHLEMLQKIARYGFRIFNIEANKYCTRCCEYSMINELCMPQFGVFPLAINIPQPVN